MRIRISGSGLKQDMYRLAQVVGIPLQYYIPSFVHIYFLVFHYSLKLINLCSGTSKAIEPYKTGRRTTDITLEILNLNKTEIILIDSISNQDFSEVKGVFFVK